MGSSIRQLFTALGFVVVGAIYIVVLLITLVFEFLKRLFEFLLTISSEYLEAIELPYLKLKGTLSRGQKPKQMKAA